jgi:hypothetical protein
MREAGSSIIKRSNFPLSLLPLLAIEARLRMVSIDWRRGVVRDRTERTELLRDVDRTLGGRDRG